MLPRYPYDGMIVVARMVEVEVCILGVGGVGVVSYPASSVRMDRYYICIEEVVFTGKKEREGLAYNVDMIVN